MCPPLLLGSIQWNFQRDQSCCLWVAAWNSADEDCFPWWRFLLCRFPFLEVRWRQSSAHGKEMRTWRDSLLHKHPYEKALGAESPDESWMLPRFHQLSTNTKVKKKIQWYSIIMSSCHSSSCRRIETVMIYMCLSYSSFCIYIEGDRGEFPLTAKSRVTDDNSPKAKSRCT